MLISYQEKLTSIVIFLYTHIFNIDEIEFAISIASCSEFSLPKVILIVPFATSSSKPIAFNT